MSGPPPPPPLSARERADLVAFLDGELPDEAARDLEARMSLDPRLRAEAESLKQAWELLDYLPVPEPKADFTEQTLSKLDALPADDRVTRWARRVALACAWGLTLVAAAAAGYTGFYWANPRQAGERELVRDLRLIENKEFYDRLDDFDFLEKLDDPDLFGDVTSP